MARLARAVISLLLVTRFVHADPARQIRLHTAQGPVHVYWPEGYDRATAGIVLYVHGYFTTVDRAWRQHALPEQFAASGVNAVFIACEAPARARPKVQWSDLGALLETVADGLAEPLPEGRVIAVGHSGAHRTIAEWLDDARLDTIILLDANYDRSRVLHDWLDADPEHRLIDAAVLTRRWSEPRHAANPDALVFDELPATGVLEGARDARVVYVRSQYDHMALVTGGIALPILLRAIRL